MVRDIDARDRLVRLDDETCTTVGEVLDYIDGRDRVSDPALTTRDCPARRTPALTPQLLIDELLVDIDLPTPGAHIAPGWMLTGKNAYLETGADLTYTHPPLDTPLGPLAFTATSEIWVDWGDGTITGPHHDPGAPYPDGTITHAYSRSGHYTVTVTQRWAATWAIGDTSGTIDGLETTTTLDQFEVRSYQAVRNR